MKLSLLAVACVACTTDPDVTEPILASDPTQLAFTNSALDYQIDVHANTISGSQVREVDGRSCRFSIAGRVALDNATTDHLAEILGATFVTTLGADSCKKLEAGCGGDPSGYLAVTIDGGEWFTAHEDCHHLSSQYDLELALGDVFDAAGPAAEAVAWDGSQWVSLGVGCQGFSRD